MAFDNVPSNEEHPISEKKSNGNRYIAKGVVILGSHHASFEIEYYILHVKESVYEFWSMGKDGTLYVSHYYPTQHTIIDLIIQI
jgi:hypothetical protein